MDVGEAEVAAGVAVSQLLVIEAELVKHGGVEVVEVDAVVDGGDSVLALARRRGWPQPREPWVFFSSGNGLYWPGTGTG